jgi:hypothetical protein
MKFRCSAYKLCRIFWEWEEPENSESESDLLFAFNLLYLCNVILLHIIITKGRRVMSGSGWRLSQKKKSHIVIVMPLVPTLLALSSLRVPSQLFKKEARIELKLISRVKVKRREHEREIFKWNNKKFLHYLVLAVVAGLSESWQRIVISTLSQFPLLRKIPYFRPKRCYGMGLSVCPSITPNHMSKGNKGNQPERKFAALAKRALRTFVYT